SKRQVKSDYIESALLIQTLGNYTENSFVHFLLQLFPFDAADVSAAVKEYFIGTLDGFTIFPYIDQEHRICKGKALKFGRDGHRLQNGHTKTSLEYLLKQRGKLKQEFETASGRS